MGPGRLRTQVSREAVRKNCQPTSVRPSSRAWQLIASHASNRLLAYPGIHVAR